MRSVITEAKLTKRYNTGDYEFEEFTLGAVVDEKESGAEVLAVLKSQINEAFVGEAASKKSETKPAAKPAEEKKEEKKNGKAKPSKTSSTNDEVSNGDSDDEEDSIDATEGDADDEATDGDDSDSDDDSSDDSQEDDDDAEERAVEESQPAKGKSGKDGDKKGGKKFGKKPQTYNRSIEQHKKIFSGVLGSVNPDWKKTDKTKALAKKASEELEGQNFLDENGEVLSQFKVQVARIFKGKTK